MRLSIIRTSAIAFAIAGSLIQLTSAQTIVGGDPSTWGPPEPQHDLIVGGDPGTWGTPVPHQERIVGNDPITWGPMNDPSQGELIVGGDPSTWGTPQPHLIGGDPSTWGPPNDYHHEGFYYDDYYRDGVYPPAPVPHHGGLDQHPPVPVPHHGGLNYYQPEGLQHGLLHGNGGMPPQYHGGNIPMTPHAQPGGNRFSLPHYGAGSRGDGR